MVNKPYELNHPLYPHPLALEWVKKAGMEYEPFVGADDSRYNRWYENCMKDIIEGGAAPREMWHFIPAVYRTRDIDGEVIYYKEYIQAHDENMITHTFDHVVGKFRIQQIDRYYDYRENKPKKRFTGVIEDHYYIYYDPGKILELAELAPTGKHQQYYIVTQSGQKLTHNVFFTPKTFAYMQFDELYEIARSPVVPDVLRTKIRQIEKGELEPPTQTITKNSNTKGDK